MQEVDSASNDAAGLTAHGMLALVDAVTGAQASDRRATAAEAEAVKLRRRADADMQRAIALANAMVETFRAEGLAGLSPQQSAILRARIELIDNGEEPTNHAVARRLGIAAAAVAVQSKRIRRKLERHESRQSSYVNGPWLAPSWPRNLHAGGIGVHPTLALDGRRIAFTLLRGPVQPPPVTPRALRDA